jgi:hypothetical protein
MTYFPFSMCHSFNCSVTELQVAITNPCPRWRGKFSGVELMAAAAECPANRCPLSSLTAGLKIVGRRLRLPGSRDPLKSRDGQTALHRAPLELSCSNPQVVVACPPSTSR